MIHQVLFQCTILYSIIEIVFENEFEAFLSSFLGVVITDKV